MAEPVADHAYVFTMAGRCLRCKLVESAHPKMLTRADPLTGCPADHNSIQPKVLIGDGGMERSRCPFCQVMVEPKAITGEGAVGNSLDRGRGVLTERLKKRLQGWVGWVDFQGQGR
jgi:hypothetical protein